MGRRGSAELASGARSAGVHPQAPLPLPPLPRRFTTSRHSLQRSLSYLGPQARLRRLVQRMSKGGGEAFKVGVVGGSISYGHGETGGGVCGYTSDQLWLLFK